MKQLFILLAFSLFLGLLYAQDDADVQPAPTSANGFVNLKFALSELCTNTKSLIPVIVFLMIVAGGVVYAAGQVFGAEVRSRANVWATAMVIGSLICILLVTVVPQFLATMYGDPNVNFDCG